MTSYVRKRAWEVFQASDGTYDLFYNGRVLQYGLADKQEVRDAIRRSRNPYVHPVVYRADGSLGRIDDDD